MFLTLQWPCPLRQRFFLQTEVFLGRPVRLVWARTGGCAVGREVSALPLRSHLRGVLLSLSTCPWGSGGSDPTELQGVLARLCPVLAPRAQLVQGPSLTGAGRVGGFPEGSQLSNTFLFCLNKGVYLL